MRNEDKPGTPEDTGIGDVSSTIRSLIEREATTPREATPEPVAAPPPAAEAKPVPDRWAELRAKFAEAELEDELEDDGYAGLDEEAVAEPGPADEYAPEGQETAEDTTGPEVVEYPAEDPAPAVATVSADVAPEMPAEREQDAQPAPEQLTRTEWDSIEDHVMSKGARTIWRVAVYGVLLALPASVFILSPFGPRDTVQHHVSAMGCQFAALFDYENIEEGAPGYHAHLDEDADGIACEVKRSRIAKSGSMSGFRSP